MNIFWSKLTANRSLIRRGSFFLILLIVGLTITACGLFSNNFFQDGGAPGNFSDNQLILVGFSQPLHTTELEPYLIPWPDSLVEIRTGYSGRDGGIGVINGSLKDTLNLLKNAEEDFFQAMLNPESRQQREQGIVEKFPPEVAEIFLQGERDRAIKLSQEYANFNQFGTPIKGALFSVESSMIAEFENYWLNISTEPNSPSITLEVFEDGL